MLETTRTGHIAQVINALFPTLESSERSNAVFECVNWIYEHEPELKALTDSIQYGSDDSVDRSILSQLFFDIGYEAFENRNYTKAIQAYQKCIEMDARDIQARFELAESYIATGRLDEAKLELNDLISYVKGDLNKAHYYRRIGFIAVDEMNYELGGACYLYSLQFYDSDQVANELLYIQRMTGVYPDYDIPQILQILKDNGVYIWELENDR